MIKGKILQDYAELIIKIGVNLQPEQGLEIACPIEKSEFAVELTKAAYKYGAKIVNVRWNCDQIDKLNYANAKTETLTDIPKWLVNSKNYLVQNNFCYVAVSADDPEAFKDIPAQKLFEISKAKSKALKKYSDCVMSNGIRWCVVSVPTSAWAKKVFPNQSDPEQCLSEQIEKAMRLNTENPLLAWEEHIRVLEKRANFLNQQRFSYIHLKNAKGTDLMVGLCDGHIWTSARELAKDGVPFMANMPTEEIFTAPHRLRVDGVLKSAMPLCVNGQIIDDFYITFKKGKIVDYCANVGHGALKGLIETDKGTSRLGEIALIGKNSPIAKSNVLFYNTLFDENASCHLAIGQGYTTTVKNGDKLTKKELLELGLNDSTEHEDFMIGTPDLSVVGIKENGEKITLFADGEWVI
ncbi:MAG: aminopeptidase [Clostridiales bacterium]|nr:aminopeptidase [Clostridiales bacterium]